MTDNSLKRKVTVCITGDIDDFQRETIEECLKPYFEVLRKFNVNATIALTAKAIVDYPERAKFVLEQGHELALHGDAHKGFYGTVEEQIGRLESAKAIFKRYFGFLPCGFRAPRLEYNRNLCPALVKTGFLYDSSHYRTEVPMKVPLIGPSFNNRLSYDWRIYPFIKSLLKSAARLRYYRDPAEPFFWCGKLVELPVTGPDDYYLIGNERGPRYSPLQAPRIAEIWLDILADIKARHGKLFVLLAHPVRMSPLYMDALNIFIEGLLHDDQVEIRSLKEVAESF